MKRKQTRYTSEAEIIEAIDDSKTRLEDLRHEAEELEDRVKRGMHSMQDEERLRKVNGSVRRIEDARLPKLKQALAAFRTEVMPFTQDRGVVLQ